eukprot:6457643-Amphidinium_carterae.1
MNTEGGMLFPKDSMPDRNLERRATNAGLSEQNFEGQPAYSAVRPQAWSSLSVKWVDTDKGDEGRPNYRSRPVCRDVKRAKRPGEQLRVSELFSSMLPLELAPETWRGPRLMPAEIFGTNAQSIGKLGNDHRQCVQGLASISQVEGSQHLVDAGISPQYDCADSPEYETAPTIVDSSSASSIPTSCAEDCWNGGTWSPVGTIDSQNFCCCGTTYVAFVPSRTTSSEAEGQSRQELVYMSPVWGTLDESEHRTNASSASRREDSDWEVQRILRGTPFKDIPLVRPSRTRTVVGKKVDTFPFGLYTKQGGSGITAYTFQLPSLIKAVHAAAENPGLSYTSFVVSLMLEGSMVDWHRDVSKYPNAVNTVLQLSVTAEGYQGGELQLLNHFELEWKRDWVRVPSMQNQWVTFKPMLGTAVHCRFPVSALQSAACSLKCDNSGYDFEGINLGSQIFLELLDWSDHLEAIDPLQLKREKLDKGIEDPGDENDFEDDENGEKPDENWTPSEQQQRDLKRLHDNLGHSSTPEFIKMRGGAFQPMIRWAKHHFQCPTCEASVRPAPGPVAKRPASYSFNQLVGLELFFPWSLVNGSDVIVLNCVSWGTSCQSLQVLPDRSPDLRSYLVGIVSIDYRCRRCVPSGTV